MFGPPPIPGEGPGGRGGGRQRPSERHSGSETVPADIRIGNDGHCNKLMGSKICILGSISDDEMDGNNEPLPDFLRDPTEYSQKEKVP